MATLRRLRQQPPRGFTYLQAETRELMRGDNFEELVDRVIAHRAYKELKPTNKEAVAMEIQRQICSRLGEADCRPEGPDDPWRPMEDRTFLGNVEAILNVSKAALDWIREGRELVPIEEAERRRQICLSCPCNVPLGRCAKCGINRVIALAIPAERRFEDLHSCQACGCDLRSKVNMTADFLRTSDAGRGINYVPGCWVPAVVNQAES